MSILGRRQQKIDAVGSISRYQEKVSGLDAALFVSDYVNDKGLQYDAAAFEITGSMTAGGIEYISAQAKTSGHIITIDNFRAWGSDNFDLFEIVDSGLYAIPKRPERAAIEGSTAYTNGPMNSCN